MRLLFAATYGVYAMMIHTYFADDFHATPRHAAACCHMPRTLLLFAYATYCFAMRRSAMFLIVAMLRAALVWRARQMIPLRMPCYTLLSWFCRVAARTSHIAFSRYLSCRFVLFDITFVTIYYAIPV